MNFHIISFWSKTQSTVALSSGEAELNALVKGCCDAIGVLELLRELGADANLNCKTTLQTDSSAASGGLVGESCERLLRLLALVRGEGCLADGR